MVINSTSLLKHKATQENNPRSSAFQKNPPKVMPFLLTYK